MHIDHLVWYSDDLEQGRAAIAAFADRAPAYGGEHPGEGTANWLMGLGPETYLEILGRDPKQEATSLDAAIRFLSGSGLYHWAVSGVELEVLQKRVNKAGLIGGKLVSGGRITPDGTKLSWTCYGLHNHEFGSLVPFFIDWRDSEHPARSAPKGARLARFEIFAPQTSALEAVFEAIGLEIAVKEREAAGLSARLESTRGSLELRSFVPLPRGYVI